ncbi:hypothetical protein KNO49_01520 [Latilactobacillus sakei]|mgnify:CR=1 FL=1|nr:hypothetical protein [Latilactobacillus sakei]MDM5044600.1 hypothetical protein [Latilactobacillus sakei]
MSDNKDAQIERARRTLANLHHFMTDLAIPAWLEHEAHDIIAEYYAA